MSGDDSMSEDDFSGSNVEYVEYSRPKDFAAALSPLTANMSGDDNMSEDDFSGSNVEYVDNSCPKDFAAAVSPLTANNMAPVECSRPKDFAAAVSPLTANNMSGQGNVGDTNSGKNTQTATLAIQTTPSHTHHYRGTIGQVNHQNGEGGIQNTGGSFNFGK